MKNKLYVINGKTYLSHINDEVVPCAGYGEAVR